MLSCSASLRKGAEGFSVCKGGGVCVWSFGCRLLKRAIEYDEGFKDCRSASVLDKYYIPTRYPNGLPGGVPYEAFDEADAKRAIELAKSVIEIVKKKLEV